MDICALGDRGSTESNLRAQPPAFAQNKTLHSLKYHEQEVQLVTDWDTHVCSQELLVWRASSKQCHKLCLITPDSRLLLNGSKPDSDITNDHTLLGCQAIDDGWVMIKPELQLLRSPPELPLWQVANREANMEIGSHVRKGCWDAAQTGGMSSTPIWMATSGAESGSIFT